MISRIEPAHSMLVTLSSPHVASPHATRPPSPPSTTASVSADRAKSNFASVDLGAKVLDSNPEAKGPSRILTEDRDSYMLNLCSAPNKFVTVELSEEIMMHSLAIADFEFHSSSVKEFRAFGSTQYPCVSPYCSWEQLGTFTAKKSQQQIQLFTLSEPSLVRFLKLEFLTHYGSEFYCTLSLLRVHGSTLIQDLKHGYEEDEVINKHRSAQKIQPRVDDSSSDLPMLASPVLRENNIMFSRVPKTFSVVVDSSEERASCMSTPLTTGPAFHSNGDTLVELHNNIADVAFSENPSQFTTSIEDSVVININPRIAPVNSAETLLDSTTTVLVHQPVRNLICVPRTTVWYDGDSESTLSIIDPPMCLRPMIHKTRCHNLNGCGGRNLKLSQEDSSHRNEPSRNHDLQPNQDTRNTSSSKPITKENILRLQMTKLKRLESQQAVMEQFMEQAGSKFVDLDAYNRLANFAQNMSVMCDRRLFRLEKSFNETLRAQQQHYEDLISAIYMRSNTSDAELRTQLEQAYQSMERTGIAVVLISVLLSVCLQNAFFRASGSSSQTAPAPSPAATSTTVDTPATPTITATTPTGRISSKSYYSPRQSTKSQDILNFSPSALDNNNNDNDNDNDCPMLCVTPERGSPMRRISSTNSIRCGAVADETTGRTKRQKKRRKSNSASSPTDWPESAV